MNQTATAPQYRLSGRDALLRLTRGNSLVCNAEHYTVHRAIILEESGHYSCVQYELYGARGQNVKLMAYKGADGDCWAELLSEYPLLFEGSEHELHIEGTVYTLATSGQTYYLSGDGGGECKYKRFRNTFDSSGRSFLLAEQFDGAKWQVSLGREIPVETFIINPAAAS